MCTIRAYWNAGINVPDRTISSVMWLRAEATSWSVLLTLSSEVSKLKTPVTPFHIRPFINPTASTSNSESVIEFFQ